MQNTFANLLFQLRHAVDNLCNDRRKRICLCDGKFEGVERVGESLLQHLLPHTKDPHNMIVGHLDQ